MIVKNIMDSTQRLKQANAYTTTVFPSSLFTFYFSTVISLTSALYSLLSS